MTAFASNLAAINAARKAHGASYREFVNFEKVDGSWFIQVKQPMDRSTAVTSLLTPVEGKWVFPVSDSNLKVSAKSAAQLEQEKAAQAFFNSRPAPESASDEEIDAIEKQQKLADKQANNALFEGTDADYLRAKSQCPKCGSTEVFTGFIGKTVGGMGLVEDDDRVGGCHACDFSFDERKSGTAWVRQSTIEKPTKAVWVIADEMRAANPSVSRKEVQDECVRRGIASGTARTQYQAWKKANDATLDNAAHAAALSAKMNGR